MMIERVINGYFVWLCDLVCKDRYSDRISYRKLLMHLHNTEFKYFIARDGNRANDGEDLRYRFAQQTGIEHAEKYLDDPCSVLEMMVALAIRCEETIMDSPDIGDRTRQWFWYMIVNLGLGDMTDEYYDKQHVTEIIQRFLDREYEPDGKGGLFTIKNCEHDLRDVEIWYQLCWYLDSIT